MKGRGMAEGCLLRVGPVFGSELRVSKIKFNHCSDIILTNLKALELSCDNRFAIRRKMLQIATQVPVRRQEIIIHPVHNHPHTVIDV